MRFLMNAARWEGIILIASLAVVTLWRLFQDASFAGLLRSGDGSISPGRIQLLVLTIMAALQYLLTTIHDPSQLHALPPNLVAALGGSQVIYLGAKAWTIAQVKSNNKEPK